MRTTFQLLKKELLSLFTTPIATILLFVFLLVNGYIFWILVTALNDPRVQVESSVMQLFFGGTLFFWFLVILVSSVVTMRLFSEESRQGTLELLMTSPVRESEVVCGKFCAAFLFYVFLWIPTLAYPLLLKQYSSLDWGPIWSGYLGVLLLGALFNAIGLFTSTLTKNQIIAAVLSFTFSLGLFSLSFLEFFIPLPEWGRIFNYVNMLDHMDNFGKGVLDSRILTYMISLTVFFLFLTVKRLGLRKQNG